MPGNAVGVDCHADEGLPQAPRLWPLPQRLPTSPHVRALTKPTPMATLVVVCLRPKAAPTRGVPRGSMPRAPPGSVLSGSMPMMPPGGMPPSAALPTEGDVRGGAPSMQAAAMGPPGYATTPQSMGSRSSAMMRSTSGAYAQQSATGSVVYQDAPPASMQAATPPFATPMTGAPPSMEPVVVRPAAAAAGDYCGTCFMSFASCRCRGAPYCKRRLEERLAASSGSAATKEPSNSNRRHGEWHDQVPCDGGSDGGLGVPRAQQELPAREASQVLNISVGDAVAAHWGRDGAWFQARRATYYPGHVETVNADGTLGVRFQDESLEPAVPAWRVRRGSIEGTAAWTRRRLVRPDSLPEPRAGGPWPEQLVEERPQEAARRGSPWHLNGSSKQIVPAKRARRGSAWHAAALARLWRLRQGPLPESQPVSPSPEQQRPHKAARTTARSL